MSQNNIAFLEAQAVFLGVENLCPNEPIFHVVIDNTTVAGGLNRRRSTSFHVNKVIMRIQNKYRIASITYVQSDNNPADPLSRGKSWTPDNPEREEAIATLLQHHEHWANYI